jgi:hypothetical protein
VLTSTGLLGYFCDHPHRGVRVHRSCSSCRRLGARSGRDGFKARASSFEAVDALGIEVLAFIVADVDRIIQFLNVTGLQPETLRESAQSSLFLLGVLDYVSKDDELLKAIHQQLDIAPAAILTALGHQAPASETKPLDRKTEAVPPLPRRNLFK